MRKKICVFTGTRAEYGLLKPLMDEIKSDKTFRLQVIASGSHLSQEFGLTFTEIEKDGFIIDEKVDIELQSDTPEGICSSTALGIVGFSKAYTRLQPDLIVILGDRYEGLAAAFAATVHRIPIAHLHGGEATFGVIDEAIRHSITKMSYLHFASTEQYRRRIIQLGEDPRRVFNVGALGLDNIRKMRLLSKPRLEKELTFRFNRRNLLVTFHSVTLEKNTSGRQFQRLLNVLDGSEDTNIIFTKTNADTEGRIINKMIDTYVSENRHKAIVLTSMGQLRYLSTLQFVDAVVGNSSSGITEAPSFRIATINIGDRQAGRIRVASIIDCDPTCESISRAIKRLYSPAFQKRLKRVRSVYGDGHAAERIMRIIKKIDISAIDIKKKFYDIRFRL